MADPRKSTLSPDAKVRLLELEECRMRLVLELRTCLSEIDYVWREITRNAREEIKESNA